MSSYALNVVKHGTTNIPVASLTFDPAVQALIEGTSSSIDPAVAAVRAGKPIASGICPDLGAAFGLTLSAGVPVGVAASAGSPIIIYQGKETATGPSSAADSLSLTINEGHLVFESLSGEPGAISALSIKVYATYDGTNVPFIVASNATLPSVTALETIWSQANVVVDYGSVSTIQVPVSTATLSTGWTESHEKGAGDIYPTFAAQAEIKPTLDFETAACKSLLDVCGVDSLLTRDVINYTGKVGTVGFAAGSVHVSSTFNDATLAFNGFKATHGDVTGAKLQYKAYGVYGSATHPLVIATTAALPTVTRLTELFTTGPIIVGGTTFEVLDMALNMGLTVDHGGHGGVVYPTRANIQRRAPTFTVQVMDQPNMAIFGAAASGAKAFLRKVSQNSTRVADANEEHIKFTFSGLGYPNAVPTQWGQKTIMTITWAVTGAIVIDTTAAIG